ncbi:MAG: IS200/IS605 family transposase [Lewinella sp.]
MPQSYARIILHTTWSTKYRMPYISVDIEKRVYRLITSLFKDHGCAVLEIGGTPDHVHVVHSLPRTKSVAEIMKAVKSVSSIAIKAMNPAYEWFSWQDGYGSFSVDYRKLDGLLAYVRNQKRHHGIKGDRMTFETEYSKMLVAYGFPDFNPEYQFPVSPDPEGRPV